MLATKTQLPVNADRIVQLAADLRDSQDSTDGVDTVVFSVMMYQRWSWLSYVDRIVNPSKNGETGL